MKTLSCNIKHQKAFTSWFSDLLRVQTVLKFCLFHCVFCLFVELLFEKCTGGTREGWARVGGLKGILSVDRNDIQRFLDFCFIMFFSWWSLSLSLFSGFELTANIQYYNDCCLLVFYIMSSCTLLTLCERHHKLIRFKHSAEFWTVKSYELWHHTFLYRVILVFTEFNALSLCFLQTWGKKLRKAIVLSVFLVAWVFLNWM